MNWSIAIRISNEASRESQGGWKHQPVTSYPRKGHHITRRQSASHSVQVGPLNLELFELLRIYITYF